MLDDVRPQLLGDLGIGHEAVEHSLVELLPQRCGLEAVQPKDGVWNLAFPPIAASELMSPHSFAIQRVTKS